MTSTDTHTTVLDESPAPMKHRQVLEALSGILLGMFVSILASSIVSSSLPRIVSDLHGGQEAFTWVVTATLLTMTISTPIWGKLADITNRKLLIQLALVISVLSAAAAGFSQNTAELITFRAFQGIGAGGLTALGSVLIADIISPRERGRYMGLMGAVMGIGMVGGPILGGTLTDSLGWRWNFFIGLPFALAAIVVLQRTLHLPPMKRKTVSIDYLGASLISVGVAGLLIWVTYAGTKFDWVSVPSAVFVLGSLAVLALAVWAESRAADPIVPLRLFKNRMVVVSVVASVFVGVAMFGSSVFLSQYMQVSRGQTPTVSGLLTIPMVIGLLGSSTVSGNLISRTGRYKSFMIAGSLLLAGGLGLMGTIDYHTSIPLICVFLFVIGVGVGMLMQNLVLVAQNTLDIKDMGAGTASIAFFRTLGGAIGVSVLGAILGTKVASGIASGLKGLGIDAGSSGLSGDIPDVSTLPGPIKDVVEHAYGDGIAEIFLVAAPLALIAFLAVLFIKEVALGNRSGVEQRLSAELGAEGIDLPEDGVVGDQVAGAALGRGPEDRDEVAKVEA